MENSVSGSLSSLSALDYIDLKKFAIELAEKRCINNDDAFEFANKVVEFILPH